MIRTFIGVRIPENPPLRRLLAQLSRLGGALRPVPLAGLHVTLKFLGDTQRSQVPAISAAMQRVAEGQSAMRAALRGLGAFPHAHRPAVVWVGVQNAERLQRIAAELEQELAGLGSPPEGRSFQPHLTVLRVKSRPPPELFELLRASADAEYGAAHIESLELFQSELHPDGSRYTSLARVPLPTRDAAPGS